MTRMCTSMLAVAVLVASPISSFAAMKTTIGDIKIIKKPPMSVMISVHDCIALKGTIKLDSVCASGMQCNPHQETQPGGQAVCITSLNAD